MWCLSHVPGILTVKVAQRSSSTTPCFLLALIYHSLQLLWQHLLVCLLEWRVSASCIPLTGADVWGRDAVVFRLCKQQIWDLHGRAATIIPVTLNIIVLSVFVCLSVRTSFFLLFFLCLSQRKGHTTGELLHEVIRQSPYCTKS